MSALDAPSQQRLSGFMRAHLTEGGLVLAAAHGSLGIGETPELRLSERVPEPQS